MSNFKRIRKECIHFGLLVTTVILVVLLYLIIYYFEVYESVPIILAALVTIVLWFTLFVFSHVQFFKKKDAKQKGR